MEFAIAIFIGVWMTASVVLAYIGLKKDYRDAIIKTKEKGDKE